MGDSSNEVKNSMQDKELERIRRSIQKKSEVGSAFMQNPLFIWFGEIIVFYPLILAIVLSC